jgi:ABC-2 type transport system ATP-binding protein
MRPDVHPVPGAPAVEFRGVSKAFGDTPALQDASFSLEPGRVHALLGPNGSGKTTAIDILTGGRRADVGEVRAFGHRVYRGGPTAYLVSLMPQAVDFPEYLTCREVLALCLAHYPNASPLDEVLRRFDLEPIASRQTGGLSGGQAKSLALACAVGGNTRMVVLDEPSASLDVFGRDRVARVVHDVCDRGGTVLLASHDMQEVERLADSILCLRRGQVLGRWSVDDFRAMAAYRTLTFATSLPAVRVRELCRAGGLDPRPDARVPGRWHVDSERSDAAARLLLETTRCRCLTIAQPGIAEVFERIVSAADCEGVCG